MSDLASIIPKNDADVSIIESEDLGENEWDLTVTGWEEFQDTEDVKTLRDAVSHARLAVRETPAGHVCHGTRIGGLGSLLLLQYRHTGATKELDEAIELSRKVLTQSSNLPDQGSHLGNLGSMLQCRYERTRQDSDFLEALRVTREAASFISDPEDLAMLYSNMGHLFLFRYGQTGIAHFLDDAILAVRQAIETSSTLSEQANYLDSLGIKLQSQFQCTGDLNSIEEAIQVAQQAVNWTSKGPHQAYMLNNLGTSLVHKYELTGEIALLERAIALTQQAVELTPEGEDLTLGPRLSNLGNQLGQRYTQTERMDDLEDAIQALQTAVHVTPEDDPDYPGLLSSLGNQLLNRYKRVGDDEDIQKAVRVSRRAVEMTPKDHVDRAGTLSNFGNCLSRWYRLTGELQDIEEAVDVTRQAVNSTQIGHPYRGKWLTNLGNRLHVLYEITGDLDDINDAIRVSQLAVDSTSEEHSDRTRRFSNLGYKLETLFERTGDIKDLKNACDCFFQAWNCETGISFHRIEAAGRLLQLLPVTGRVEEALKVARSAVVLLPLIVDKSLDREDRQHLMSLFPGIAADSCALFLEVKEPEEAIQHLEKSRAVILGQLMDDRSNLSQLTMEYPELANTYENLCAQINAPVRKRGGRPTLGVASIERRATVKELDDCIQTIRGVSGFHRFLSGQTIPEIQKCAIEGNIIIVNVAELRSDAIIISSTSIESIELPKLTAPETRKWIQKDWIAKGGRMDLEYLEFLSWIWDVCVKHVLNHNLSAPNSVDDLPRVWWIGTGLANSLPFHAAGRHMDSFENASYRAISSYTPSIKALAYARDHNSTKSAESPVLIVTMPTTPGMAALRAVEKERRAIIQAIGEQKLTVDLNGPTASDVLKHIEYCSIAHFACHGFMDHTDPSNSGLIFQKRNEHESFEAELLTFQNISEANLKNAYIAYLSACSTAQNRVAQLADEVIHVASGFQTAGFRHVVGCLWPSNDAICFQIARGFYELLFSQKGMPRNDRDVAVALHGSILKVKNENPRRPLLWAQYVHYGA